MGWRGCQGGRHLAQGCQGRRRTGRRREKKRARLGLRGPHHLHPPHPACPPMSSLQPGTPRLGPCPSQGDQGREAAGQETLGTSGGSRSPQCVHTRDPPPPRIAMSAMPTSTLPAMPTSTLPSSDRAIDLPTDRPCHRLGAICSPEHRLRAGTRSSEPHKSVFPPPISDPLLNCRDTPPPGHVSALPTWPGSPPSFPLSLVDQHHVWR